MSARHAIAMTESAALGFRVKSGWAVAVLLAGPGNAPRVKLDAAGLEGEVEKLGRFAVIVKAEPLSIKQLKISPNPFSPAEGPVEIAYSISSNETSTPEVTLKVYNMIGDLVKSLVVAEPQPRGENVVEWDGFTDFGRMARNGRYVLHLKVKDISGQKEMLKPFVLIK